MDYNKIFHSKIFKALFFAVCGLFLLSFGFRIGMSVGFRKANFSYRWGENYHKNFAGPRGGFFENMDRNDFMGAHGVFGQILKIENNTLAVKGLDGVEKSILVKEDTAIEHLRYSIKLNDLKQGDHIVVIGDPKDSGVIEAKFIRLMPAPPKESASGSPRLFKR